ncbi:DUF1294 domain-containing protein [Pseudoflavonifractor capillosus]|uniref:DUF1294 domain-containing protein n=1 Tax=Pseudoflavonifractor capillosus TaxID=106588 RepID=UPI001958A039|nr:DUF1294 domain-containing protein [Pseudoflavonifractor capillosus]MBM6896644.1 DUF1294 domain-containing protein [Pseudoflavonifractor capillosus]
MTERLYLLLVWFGVLSAFTLLLFGWDKLMAKLGRRRIPEASLLFSCLAGGAVGGFVGMHLFHHKIRKPKFYVTIPLLVVLDAAIFVAVLVRS